MDWLAAQPETELFLSVLTLGELQKGVARLPPTSKRHQIGTWLHQDLRNRFAERILNITDSVAIAWGNLQAEAEKKGRRLPTLDSLIAATAITHQLTVVTRNTTDMTAAGVKIFDPWGV